MMKKILIAALFMLLAKEYTFSQERRVLDSLEIQLLKSQQEVEQLNANRRLGMNFSLGGALLGVMFVAYGFYYQFKKAKLLNTNLEKAYKELEDTQQQLVRSEKMAAFGVMASRVSHEILNPLNFVNNFSEMAQELVDDVLASSDEKSKNENALQLKENLKKISEHGKRATTIVKLLQEHTTKGTAHEFFESN
ncbi:MAG: hypothetical protein KA444_02965 [Bacteroidia bacterium]|nr:hypothetical protein [Bacteroidia bacterium]